MNAALLNGPRTKKNVTIAKVYVTREPWPLLHYHRGVMRREEGARLQNIKHVFIRSHMAIALWLINSQVKYVIDHD